MAVSKEIADHVLEALNGYQTTEVRAFSPEFVIKQSTFVPFRCIDQKRQEFSKIEKVAPLIDLLMCLFGIEGHVALDRNPGPGYNTLLLWLIPGDLLSACPHRHFTHYPDLNNWVALSNSYSKALVPNREAIYTIFMMVFGMTRPRRKPATYCMRGRHVNH